MQMHSLPEQIRRAEEGLARLRADIAARERGERMTARRSR